MYVVVCVKESVCLFIHRMPALASNIHLHEAYRIVQRFQFCVIVEICLRCQTFNDALQVRQIGSKTVA